MQEIYQQLTPVRRRLTWARTLQYIGVGLVAGSLAAVVLAVASSLFAFGALRFGGWGAIGLGLIAGLLVAQVSGATWSAAARAVDAHFQLDDRVQSAVAFLEQDRTDGLYALQVDDTATRLATVNTRDAVPVQIPKPLAIGAGWLVVAVSLLLFLPAPDTVIAPDPGIASQQRATPNSDSPATSASELPEGVTWSDANTRQVLHAKMSNVELVEIEGEVVTAAELLDTRIQGRSIVKANEATE